ncbi:MAG: RrF2 family transcriptional regulator [Chloroflexota bacterium]
MRVNTRTRYATRALLELALREGEGSISLQHIAASQEISPKYLEALFSALRSAGLVQSVRGSQGGYRLARPARSITLREVYVLFEGDESLVACVDKPEECHRAADCVSREVWCQLSQQVTAVLEATTLAALAERARERQRSGIIDYVI